MRLIVQPSASGPVVVVTMLRQLHGSGVVQIGRETGELPDAFLAQVQRDDWRKAERRLA